MADAGASQRRSQYTAITGTGQTSTLEPAGSKGESYFNGSAGINQVGDFFSGTGKYLPRPSGVVAGVNDFPSYLASTPNNALVLPPPPPSGTIYYVMKAYNTNLLQYVTWTANDSPDFVGTYSGYPLIDLSAISLIGFYL